MTRTKFTHEQIVEAFWNKVEKTDSCWIWTGAKTLTGYGQFRDGLAHRFSYELANGDYDRKLDVCHKCDNPSCVNPNHLFLGTRSENMKDCADKGRLPAQNGDVAKGEDNGRAKLDWIKVREIRILYSKGDVSQRELARRYGVDNKAIHKIVHNKTWIE